MQSLPITRKTASFAVQILAKEIETTRVQYHAARRAYHHERVSSLCERLDYLRAELERAQALL